MTFIEAPLDRKIHPWRKTLELRTGIADFMSYTVTLPEPPPKEEFINHGLPPEEQFFQREKIPDWVWRYTRAASSSTKKAEEVAELADKNSEYRKFIIDQWEKRNKGVFIYIYGVPLWIPGVYWFYLNYYHIEGDLPDFRMVDLEYFLWWELCVVQDKNVYGGIEFTRRRDGKSYRLGNICLESATRNRFFNAGLQSKTNDDSKDLFQRVIVLPWRRLPFYFSPKFDNKLYPLKEINFRDPSNKEDGEVSHFGSAELNSWIEARPSVYTAFDGTKLKFYGLDESGKVEEMLVSQAYRVAKQTLRVGEDIIGKCLLTTTVEETTKGGLKEFKKIWDTSDRSALNDLGQTVSGLLPYFKAAHETFIFDQYGFSIINEPLIHQKRWRFEHGKKHWDKGGVQLVDAEINSYADSIEKQRQIRMYPRNIREAFRTDIRNCHFNITKIDERLDYFRYMKRPSDNDLVVTGNLFWIDGVVDGTVGFREQENGRWQFKKTILEWMLANANNKRLIDGIYYPGNKALGVIACDPYKYNNVDDENRRSRGVAHAYLNRIESIDQSEDQLNWQTDDLICEYSFRGTVAAFNEDLILFAVFTGLPVSAETNSGNVNEHLTSRGYHKFLKFRKKLKKKEGQMRIEEAANPGFITLGDSTKKPLFDVVDGYIETHAHRCVFPNFLEDCKEVLYEDLNPFDYFVSGSNAIYDATVGNMRIKRAEPSKSVSSGLWIPQSYGQAPNYNKNY